MCVGNMILPADIAHMPLFGAGTGAHSKVYARHACKLVHRGDTRCSGTAKRYFRRGAEPVETRGLELMHAYFRTVLNLMTFKSECNGSEIRFPPPPVDERGRNIPLRTDKGSERIDNFHFMSHIFMVYPILARGAKQMPLFRYTVHLNTDRRQICIPSTVQTGRQTKSQSTGIIHMKRY